MSLEHPVVRVDVDTAAKTCVFLKDAFTRDTVADNKCGGHQSTITLSAHRFVTMCRKYLREL